MLGTNTISLLQKWLLAALRSKDLSQAVSSLWLKRSCKITVSTWTLSKRSTTCTSARERSGRLNFSESQSTNSVFSISPMGRRERGIRSESSRRFRM